MSTQSLSTAGPNRVLPVQQVSRFLSWLRWTTPECLSSQFRLFCTLNWSDSSCLGSIALQKNRFSPSPHASCRVSSRFFFTPVRGPQEKISDLGPHCCCAKNREIFYGNVCLDSTVSFLHLTTAAMRLNGTITVSVEFEVRGELQGLYFLKHCREQAVSLGISGRVKRDRRGAIIGVIQGQRSRIEQMICWLSCRGSPGSRIDECCLDNYRYISRPEYRSFSVRY